MAFLYGPLWCIFVYNLVVFLYVRKRLYQSSAAICETLAMAQTCHTDEETVTLDDGKPTNKQDGGMFPPCVRNFLHTSSLFLIAFFVVWLWGSVNRIQEIVEPGNPIFVLALLHATFTPLLGFANFVVYFWVAMWFDNTELFARY